eukprot:6200411-Pleurochrysis_carterae.AAC.7
MARGSARNPMHRSRRFVKRARRDRRQTHIATTAACAAAAASHAPSPSTAAVAVAIAVAIAVSTANSAAVPPLASPCRLLRGLCRVLGAAAE